MQELSASTNQLLLWVASISLLVGGIGVMNIMLVSVTERTGEIGLKKAVGARKRRILFQFLTESAVLTSCGADPRRHRRDHPVPVYCQDHRHAGSDQHSAAAASVGFSMLIGIVFGLLPSVKAANLNPIDALRRE